MPADQLGDELPGGGLKRYRDMGEGSFAEVVAAVTGGQVATPVPAGTVGNTVIKATPGRLVHILVTAVGTGALTVYDNATTNAGTIIGLVPAATPVGSLYALHMPAANGITVAGAAANPGVTVSWT